MIADNASPDDDRRRGAGFADRLPIRYMRHDENIGCFANVQFVMMQAAGRYVVYLSDDDCILGGPVAATLARMEADPGIAVVFAPWKLFDLVAQQEQGQFYDVPHDLRIERDRHVELLDHLLRHHIFPEIHIARRDALQRLMPRINEHAFYAFVHAADYLSLGAVLIQKAPSTSRSRATSRTTSGRRRATRRSRSPGTATAAAWSTSWPARARRTRRGARRLAPADPEDDRGADVGRDPPAPPKKRNPLDTYYIATRLKGMGYESLLPVPMATLASEAMLEFLLHDPVINRGVDGS